MLPSNFVHLLKIEKWDIRNWINLRVEMKVCVGGERRLEMVRALKATGESHDEQRERIPRERPALCSPNELLVMMHA